MAHARREQIVEAAFACLADKGFEGLRTRDVAATAGLDIATLHYWFATKEDLIRGVHEATLARFATTLPAEGSPAERLSGHLDAIASLVENDAGLRRVHAGHGGGAPGTAPGGIRSAALLADRGCGLTQSPNRDRGGLGSRTAWSRSPGGASRGRRRGAGAASGSSGLRPRGKRSPACPASRVPPVP